jgi:two-component system response regulator DesR
LQYSAVVAADERIRIVIVEDNAVFREALELLLGLRGDLLVVASVSDGEEVVPVCREHNPNVALMDYRLPGLDGIEATRQIRAADERARVLMVTGSNSSSDVDRAREAGASGYVTKDRIAVDLVEAIVESSGRL